MVELVFQAGTIVLTGIGLAELPPALATRFRPDPRTGTLRAPALDYAETVLSLLTAKIAFTDSARNFNRFRDLPLRCPVTPYPHQQEALRLWRAHECRGVVSLPTGAGKTILAVLAMAELRRPTLVLVPTIDLLTQWAGTLEKFFGVKIGMLGGGSHDLQPLTVSTYDSATLQMEFIGNRFGFLVADECHHLPAPETKYAALMAIAPFRLGLSATPEMEPERMTLLERLLGPVVCSVNIGELEGKVLSPYEVKRVPVELSAEEQRLYQENRRIYVNFLRCRGINLGRSDGWSRFLAACVRYPDGRKALRAFFEQRKIARAGRAKIDALEQLLHRHAGERMIIFTADNDAAYSIGREFTLPVLTHHTKAAERKDFLDRFRCGDYPVLVTSKVLNEGVDVPSAAVGIVVSGSGSVREHVQRLGRILRPSAGKAQAVLYELVSIGTNEEGISERRREHQAFS